MLGASKSIHSALMKHFHYALKVAGFQSIRALSEFHLFFFLIQDCRCALLGISILGEVGGLQ